MSNEFWIALVVIAVVVVAAVLIGRKIIGGSETKTPSTQHKIDLARENVNTEVGVYCSGTECDTRRFVWSVYDYTANSEQIFAGTPPQMIDYLTNLVYKNEVLPEVTIISEPTENETSIAIDLPTYTPGVTPAPVPVWTPVDVTPTDFPATVEVVPSEIEETPATTTTAAPLVIEATFAEAVPVESEEKAPNA